MYKKDIEKYVNEFAKNGYNGKTKKGKHYIIKEGRCDVMVSAPHAVNHFREGVVKYADINTGVIANVLHEKCGCPIIYTCSYKEADANWDEPENCAYKQALKEYIDKNNIKVLIDIHGSKETSPRAVEFGTIDQNDKSLHGYSFIVDLFKICFEKHIENFQGKNIDKNVEFSAGKNTTVTNYISTVCGIPCIQIEINRIFREIDMCPQTIEALIHAVTILRDVNWNDKNIKVLKAGKSNSLFPLYKAEVMKMAEYNNGDILMACADAKSFVAVECFEKVEGQEDVVYLTNRLIKMLFGDSTDFEGRPVLLFTTHEGSFSVGRPAAERLEVAASPELYDYVTSDDAHSFLLYNRYADIKMHFEPKEYIGVKGKKIMLSYYYRRLMGVELPLQEIEADCIGLILDKLDDVDKNFLREVYQDVGNGVYKLSDEICKEERKRLIELEKSIELDKLELLKYPKEEKIKRRFLGGVNKIVEAILEFYIGSKTIAFRTCRSLHLVDDQLMIVRMSQDMMNLLGVNENDYVWIKHGNRKVSLKVLMGSISSEMIHVQNEDEIDMMISIPALARQKLKMLSINDVVRVKRDMRYCLRRHISRQVFAIMGTFLTIFTLSENSLFRLVCGIIALPIILYIDFSEERVLVKYKEKG